MADLPFYEGSDLEALADLPNYYGWIIDSFRPWLKGHVVEYGAGSGTISCRLAPLVERLDAIEPSANLLPLLRERLAGAAVSVIHDSIEGHVATVADASLDAVVMVNVLEHVEDDAAALAECRRVLKPGGALLIYVPAMAALFSDMDAKLGHFRRYGRADLAEKAKTAGFAIQRLGFVDVLGVLAWWLVHTKLRRTAVSTPMAQFYDRVGVPLTRMVERLVPAPFGKNLVLVATRPA